MMFLFGNFTIVTLIGFCYIRTATAVAAAVAFAVAGGWLVVLGGAWCLVRMLGGGAWCCVSGPGAGAGAGGAQNNTDVEQSQWVDRDDEAAAQDNLTGCTRRRSFIIPKSSIVAATKAEAQDVVLADGE